MTGKNRGKPGKAGEGRPAQLNPVTRSMPAWLYPPWSVIPGSSASPWVSRRSWWMRWMSAGSLKFKGMLLRMEGSAKDAEDTQDL